MNSSSTLFGSSSKPRFAKSIASCKLPLFAISLLTARITFGSSGASARADLAHCTASSRRSLRENASLNCKNPSLIGGIDIQRLAKGFGIIATDIEPPFALYWAHLLPVKLPTDLPTIFACSQPAAGRRAGKASQLSDLCLFRKCMADHSRN